MTANGEEENLNQHRRQSLERLDEVRHRQNRLSAATKRRNGECPQGIHEKNQLEHLALFPPETSMAMTFLFLSWVSSYSWPFVSAVFAAGSFIILAGGLIYRWHKRREYSKLLKAPFDTDFYIPKAIEHKVDYHLQDDSPHSEQELTLPPNSEHVVMIRSKARLDVALLEVLYGCMDYEKGIAYLNAMPEPLYYFNPWVKTGIMFYPL